jgi:pimeloyl-ACP methyl ester carboxylesterase
MFRQRGEPEAGSSAGRRAAAGSAGSVRRAVRAPAWETIPSWALIGTADRAIPPDQQQAMATNAGAQISTVKAGHLSLVSRPNAVTNIIQTAVDATT